MVSVFVANSSKHKNTPKKYLIERLSLKHFLFILVDSPKYFFGKSFFTSYKNAEMFVSGLVTDKQFNEAEKRRKHFINGGHLNG